MYPVGVMNTINNDIFKDKLINIIGPNKFQNELIGYFLYTQFGVNCIGNESIENIQDSDDVGIDQKSLLLLDISDKNIHRHLSERESGYSKVISNLIVALFNLRTTGIENKALNRGIRGFFYVNDTLEHFSKGVQVLFQGELWVSRNVLSKYILEDINHYPSFREPLPKNGNHNLTKREVEIIALVSVGAKNDEIAERLCISPHTVKTHLYNVFKKINVNGRLQAALWAAKEL
jgi:DNA-binding NarL/FixJ family response regulator